MKRGCPEPVRRQWWRGGGSSVGEWDEGEGTTVRAIRERELEAGEGKGSG